MNAIFDSKLNRNLASLALVGVVLALGSYAYVTLKNAGGWVGPTTINVVGTGEVAAKPDVAMFTFAVKGAGKNAAEAQTKSAEPLNNITAYLKEQGVEEKDIKTTSYNLSPKYTYPMVPCMGMYCPPSEPKQDGFEVYQSVEVKVRKTDMAGTLLSGVGERGATDISSLSFVIDDTEALRDQAREAAIKDARAEAEVLAQALGVKLVEMTGYYEESANPYNYYGMGGDMAMSAKAESMSPDMPAGENTITSRVNLTYTIK